MNNGTLVPSLKFQHTNIFHPHVWVIYMYNMYICISPDLKVTAYFFLCFCYYYYLLIHLDFFFCAPTTPCTCTMSPSRYCLPNVFFPVQVPDVLRRDIRHRRTGRIRRLRRRNGQQWRHGQQRRNGQ